ncbi:MAG: hypothetical protein PHS73_01215 [Candidatus Peribacteraceae bacterium]|nr:hypothetical protein [Candidatus Peribacteraceae bacterium]
MNMEQSSSPDFLQIVGGKHEAFHEIGSRLFAYIYAIALQLELKDGLQELAERFAKHPELPPILGYASIAREQAFAVFSRVPKEQSILIWYHGFASAAQHLVSTMRLIGYETGDAPSSEFLSRVSDRICDVFDGIRSSILRAREKIDSE